MKKILIVEDDLDTVDIVETILRNAGYAVIKVNRPIELKEIIGIRPDVILLDHWLSFARGGDLCLTVKENQATREIPVILFSACTGLKKIAKESRADAFIPKPFDLEEFLGLVKKWLP